MQYAKFFNRALKEFRLPTRPATILIMNIVLSLFRVCKNIFSNKDKKNEINLKKGLAVYDLRYQPISFDIVPFLCGAEHYFKTKGIKYFSVIVFAANERYYDKAWKDYDQKINKESQKLRIGNIIIPIIQMHKSCDSLLLVEDIDKVKEECSKGFIVFPEHYDGVNLRATDSAKDHAAAKNCFPYSGLEAPGHALEIVNKFIELKSIKKLLVSITVRNYNYQTPRNTNMEVALKLAKYLEDIGYTPIFVPDSENPFQSFLPYESFTPACYNMFYRMALYESCFTNYFTSSGPSTMAGFSPKVSYIVYKMNTPELQKFDNTNSAHFARQGISPGDQLFVHDSWWEWGEETLDNLVKAFHVVENKKNNK